MKVYAIYWKINRHHQGKRNNYKNKYPMVYRGCNEKQRHVKEFLETFELKNIR
jgi:hypothetical protein